MTYNMFFLGDKGESPALSENICPHDHFISLGHTFLLVSNNTAIDPEDFTYLRQKGCFSLPSREMQDMLIRTYFHYIHPFAPIINVPDLLYQYITGRPSFLLLWSMFAVAGNVS